MDNEELLRRGLIVEPLKAYTAGALGCALSHKSLWDHCACGEAAVTVCEDDAIFNRDFSARAATVLRGLPPDWDIILWGWNFDSVLHVELIEGMKQTVMRFDPSQLAQRTAEFQGKRYEILPMRLVAAFGIVCYSLSPRGARSLSERCFPLRNEIVSIPGLGRDVLNFGIDSIMNKHYRALRSYVCFPPLVWTENDKSTSDVSRKAGPGDAGRSPPAAGPALQAPLSVGELLDRITILKVKQAKMAGPDACRNVERELRELSAVERQVVRCGPPLDALVRGLQEVNEELWEIEDEIRACEARGDFGPRFVELARAVYKSNDRRAAIKRRINEASRSAIVEEKLYRGDEGPAAGRTAS